MAPNRVALSKNAGSNKSFFSTVYDEATNPENTTIVRSLMVFGVRANIIPAWPKWMKANWYFFQAGVAFLHSSLGELLLPP